MDLFRTETLIETERCEKLHDGIWKKISPLKITGGIILGNVADHEHDKIVNICDDLDPMELRGYSVSLHVENGDKDDPKQIDLVAMPRRGDVIRHQDHYYLVTMILQSTNYSVALFTKRIDHQQLDILKFDVAHV